MPSGWAMEKAKGVVRPLKDRIYREMSAENYDSLWDRVAAELDAVRANSRAQGRREGLEEAAQIALTEAAHLDGLNERMAKGADRVALAIRARIAQEPTA